MAIQPDEIIRADDFINEVERDATSANDAGRVPKLEGDGKLHPFFIRNGAQVNCGETIVGATTPVPVYQNKTDNELYACDANDTSKLRFIGFVVSDGTDGNPARFQGSGVVGGFSGLQEGEKYYVQDTAGTIGTTAGTYAVLVGIAISTTELLIMKGTHRASGHGTVDGANDAITCGFRPTKVTIHAVNGKGDGSTQSSIGVLFVEWTEQDGLKTAQGYETMTSGDNGNSNSPRLSDNSTSYTTFGISSVTDTGFTVTQSNTGSPTSGSYVWYAEGEL